MKHTTIDAYIDAQPPHVAERLSAIRHVFHEVVPDVVESVSYNIPCFKIGHEKLYIAGYPDHVGMYPMYGIPELQAMIAPYRGKGTKDSLHFRHDQPLPVEVILEIILAKAKQ